MMSIYYTWKLNYIVKKIFIFLHVECGTQNRGGRHVVDKCCIMYLYVCIISSVIEAPFHFFYVIIQ